MVVAARHGGQRSRPEGEGDYIVKYGIEEKLSEAVNVAIKQESTDPFRVISEYLKQFAEVRAAARVAGSGSHPLPSRPAGRGRTRRDLAPRSPARRGRLRARRTRKTRRTMTRM